MLHRFEFASSSSPIMSETKKDLHIGIVGAGIGGLTAAIAIVRAGAKVTVLEAAEELGEVRFSPHSRSSLTHSQPRLSHSLHQSRIPAFSSPSAQLTPPCRSAPESK